MVRTKKHFRPPSQDSSSSSSESSSSEDEDDQHASSNVVRGRGKQLGPQFGRGKQLSLTPPQQQQAVRAAPAGGRGKQLRRPDPESEDDSSDDSSSEDEDDVPPPPQMSRGKQLRPVVSRGKQLRAPSPPAAGAQEDEDSSSSEEDEVTAPAPAMGARGRGKMFGRGKMLQPPAAAEDDSSSSSSEDEPWAQQPAITQRGQGKQLRPPPSAAAPAAKDESDMEESSSSSEEEEEPAPAAKKKPAPKPKAKPAPKKKAPPKKKAAPKKAAPKRKAPARNKKKVEVEKEEDDSDESDFEPESKPASKRRGRPPARAAATRAARSAKKGISYEEEDEEDEEDEESSAGEEEEEEDDESESEEEELDDMETFDMQKLVKNKEDQKYLDSLNELERENILAERFEKRKQEADMKKALRENKRREREQKKAAGGKKAPAKNKRKAPAKKKAAPAKRKAPARKKKVETESESEEDYDEEEDPATMGDEALAKSLAGKRVSARNLDKKGKQFQKRAALAKLRETRANKQAVAEESESDLDYGHDSDDSDDDYEESTMLKPWQKKGKKIQLAESSDDESMGVEDEQPESQGSGKVPTTDVEAELEDYQKVSIPRRRLMRWCNEPFFEKAVKDFYVRLGIGRDNKTQKACYRLCKINGIVVKNEYSFPSIDGKKPVTTDKWMSISFGSNVRDFKMITVSDHRPSYEDVNQLVSQLKTERLSDELLTKKSATKLRRRQDELVNNYTYTKEDIEMLVEEKKKRSKKSANIASEKTRIALAVQAARDEVEDAKKRLEDAKVERMEAADDMTATAESNVTQAKEALERAEEKLKTKVEEQEKIQMEDQERGNRLKKNAKAQNWVKVNQKARLANQRADYQSYKEQQEREKIHGSAEQKFDPYARRRQQPKNLWEVGGPKQAGEKASEISTVEEEKKEATPIERDDSNAGKDGENNKREEAAPEPQKLELSGQSNQFAFDDDIVIGGDIANLAGMGKKKLKARVRKGISLEEYQERKNAGTL